MQSKNKYNLTKLLFNKSPLLLCLSMLAGLLAGIGYSLIIPLLFQGMETRTDNLELAQAAPAEPFVMWYFLLCGIILLLRSFSLVVVTILTKDIMADLRISLCKKIHLARVKEIENIGFPKLINILTQDIQFMGFAASGIPILFIESITILGLLAYLFFLDWKISLFTTIALISAAILLRVPLAIAEKYMSKARHVLDQLQFGVKGLIFGSYELKLNHAKAKAFIKEEIEIPEREAAYKSKIADSMMMSAGNLASVISFLMIGILAFIVPKFINIESSHALSIVLVMLYVISPIGVIFSVIPNLRRGNVALQYTMELYELDEEESDALGQLDDWNEITLNGISYYYSKESQDTHDSFYLQPTDLKFRKGEITFIVGGNGSGKSTLSKIISMHYKPSSGSIYFGKTKIDTSNAALARKGISVIYSNYFLFDKLYKNITVCQQDKIRDWLVMLELQDKTDFVDGRFTTTSLSDGQRRRLALLVAILEDTDVYILDEWAADQDPVFKDIFYKKIIHQLKADNKMVIVVTHDDRYFSQADRTIHMEDGRVSRISSSTPEALLEATN